MTAVIIGLITTAAVVAFAEVFRNIDVRFYASLNLAVIPFIYIGFSVEPSCLLFTIPAASFFIFLTYWGYKRYYFLIAAGLALHAIWDLVFPRFSTITPAGYDRFCITVDVVLALYFYLKLKPKSAQLR